MTNISSTDMRTLVGNKIAESKDKMIFNEPIRTYSKPYYVTAVEEANVITEKLALGPN